MTYRGSPSPLGEGITPPLRKNGRFSRKSLSSPPIAWPNADHDDFLLEPLARGADTHYIGLRRTSVRLWR